MAGSDSVKPTRCRICGATPRCNYINCTKCSQRLAGTCVNGVWSYQSEVKGNLILWYTICPDCYSHDKCKYEELTLCEHGCEACKFGLDSGQL